MMIVIPKFLLFVMMTTAVAAIAAAAVAADSSSSNLETKLAVDIEEEKSLLDSVEGATTTTTTTTPLLSSSLSSLLEVSGATPKLASFTATDGDDDLAQRKLSKSTKKVKHPEALCTLSLFADSVFMYENQCYDDIMVTISPCDDKDDTCYISERLPSLPQEEEENQEEEQCFVGGSFPAKQNIRYNPSTGDCEFLYVKLTDDPCNLYIGDTGTGSLGLKARINVKNSPHIMFIQFTNDKGLTFYNAGDERVAKKRSPTHNVDRYLLQEGATKPVLSMLPHPFPSSQRQLYKNASVKNDTPYDVYWIGIEYYGDTILCSTDTNDFIASGGTWTVGGCRGSLLITAIYVTLVIYDQDTTQYGRGLGCQRYSSSGTGYSEFYIMLIDGECCVRSWAQDADKCE